MEAMSSAAALMEAMSSAALPAMETLSDLSSDVQREVLLRIPYQFHDKFRAVCRSWETVIDSPGFLEDREKLGKREHLICIMQTLQILHDPGVRAWSSSISNTGITVYDPVTGRWGRIPPAPIRNLFPSKCELLCVCGKLVLLGGCSLADHNMRNPVFIYDFQSRKWRQGADMPTSRSGFACSVASSEAGKALIYVAGGSDGHGNILATAEAYDVEADSWVILPPMTENRKNGLGVFMEGKFMVVSGSNPEHPYGLTSAEVLDTKTSTWNSLQGMWSLEMDIRSCLSCTVSTSERDYLYVIHRLKRVMSKYDPQKNVWTSVPVAAPGIAVIKCVAPWHDRIFVSGTDREGRDTVSYLFQPSTGESTAIDTGGVFVSGIDRGVRDTVSHLFRGSTGRESTAGDFAGHLNHHAATVHL